MANSKMAVRKNSPKKRKIEFPAIVKFRSIFRWFATLLVIVSVATLYSFSVETWNNVWPVNNITLVGEIKYLKSDAIIDFVEALPVKGMLAIDLVALQDATKNIDWVKAVEVRKVWPNELTFSLIEHIPVALIGSSVLTQQGTLIEVQDNSNLFEGLPQIDLFAENTMDLSVYQSIWEEFKLVRRQFELLSLELSSLYVDRVNNWHLKFNNGMQLNLGRRDRLQRIERLVKVYSAIINKHNIKSIDLRYHNGLAVEWFTEKELELKS